jgi:hypothetical protein
VVEPQLAVLMRRMKSQAQRVVRMSARIGGPGWSGGVSRG